MKLTLNGDYIRDRSENAADSLVDIDAARANNNVRTEAAYFGLTVDSRFMTGDPYKTYVTYEDQIPAGTVIAGNSYYNGTRVNGRPTRGGYELPPHVDLTNWGVSGKLAWDLGGATNLTTVVGFRSLDEVHTFDTDGMPLVVEHVINDIRNDYLNAEVRLSGKSSRCPATIRGRCRRPRSRSSTAMTTSPMSWAPSSICSTIVCD